MPGAEYDVYIASPLDPSLLLTFHFSTGNTSIVDDDEMEFLKIIANIDPASRQIILKAYMGADKGFFMAGYMVGLVNLFMD